MGNAAARTAPVSPDEARRRFSAREQDALQRGFDRLCRAGAAHPSAGIALPAFQQLVLADVPDMPEPLVRRVFAVCDADGSGALSFAELIAGLCVLCRGKFEERARFLFAVYDDAGAGALQRPALERFARLLEDDRLPADARVSSHALIEELFAAGETVTLQAFSERLAKFMDAPLASWPGMLGQRLLAPLFGADGLDGGAVDGGAVDAAAGSSAGLRLRAGAAGASASPRGQMLAPLQVHALHGEAQARAHTRALPPRPATPLARQLSTSQQLQEGGRFVDALARSLAPSALAPGDERLLVSAEWFAGWRRFVGMTHFDARSGVCRLDLAHLEVLPPPGPIDNTALLLAGPAAGGNAHGGNAAGGAQEAGPFVALRPGLALGSDFVLLNRAAWELLRSAHGGGPELARAGVMCDAGVELDMYPVTLNVRCAAFARSDEDYGGGDGGSDGGSGEAGGRGGAARVVLSQRATVRELARAISEAVLPPPDAALVSQSPPDALRVWCVLGSLDAALDDALAALETRVPQTPQSPTPQQQQQQAASVKLLPDLEATLEDSDIGDGRTVVLEVCGHDGRWPLASAETLRSLRPRAPTADSAPATDTAEVSAPCGAEARRALATGRPPAPRVVLLGGGGGGDGRKGRAKAAGAAGSQLAVLSSASARASAAPPPRAPLPSRVPARGGRVDAHEPDAAGAQTAPARGRIGSVMSVRRVGPGARVPGNVGLCNLGNTCFMSASVQCLLHTQPLKQYLLDGAYVRDMNVDAREGSKGRLADAFADVVRHAWTQGSGGGGQTALSPRRLKRELGRHDARFANAHQHDAQEMLSALLDALAQDLNRVHSKAYVELKDSDGRADEEVAREWWEAHLRRELSVVTALFTGQYKSIIACGACGYESARFEPFQTLSLSLPESPLRTVLVHVVFADAARPPLLVGLRVDKTGTFADVRAALLALQPGARGAVSAALDDSEQQRASVELRSDALVLAYVFERHVHSVIADDRRLAALRDRDPVYAFVLPRVHAARAGADRDAPGMAPEAADESDAAGDGDGDGPAAGAAAAAEAYGEDVCTLEVGAHVCVASPSARGGDSGSAMPTMGLVTAARGRTSKKQGSEPRYQVTVLEAAGRRERSLVVPQSQLTPEPLPAAVFRVEQREWHKHACYFLNPLRPAAVGFPFLLRLRPDRVTGRELYQLVAAQLRGGSGGGGGGEGPGAVAAAQAQGRALQEREGAEEEAEADEGEELAQRGAAQTRPASKAPGLSDADIRAVWGFKLVLLSERGGGTCGCCSWMQPCDGCALPPDDALLSLLTPPAAAALHPTLAVDWGLSRGAAHAGSANAGSANAGSHNAAGTAGTGAPALTLDLVDKHDSVDAARREEMAAMPLSSLLSRFVHAERLQDAEQVRCGKCKEFRDHDKKIELWRVPPVLVVHLKRFDRQRKLLNLVQFPLEDLSLREFLAEAQPAHEPVREPPAGGNSGKSARRATASSAGTSTGSSRKSDRGGSGGGGGPQQDSGAAGEHAGDAAEQDEDAPAAGGHVAGGSGPRGKAAKAGGAEAPQDADAEQDSVSASSSASASSAASGDDSKPSAASKTTSSTPTLSPEDAAAQEDAQRLAEEMMDSEFVGLRCYGGRAHGGIAPEYDLYGVVEHAGSLGGGHYIAKARSSVTNDWYLFDDSSVQRIDPDAVQTSRAYLLFYVRKDVAADPDVRRLFPCEPMEAKEAARRVREMVPPPPGASACALM